MRLALAFIVVASRLLAQQDTAKEREAAALVRDAIAKQRAGNLAAAAEEYRKFLNLYPDAAAIHSNLGATLAGLGRFEEAIPEYKEALREKPGLRDAELNLAIAYYKMGRIGDAAQELVKGFSASPPKMQPKMLLADCYFRMGRNKEVIRLLEPVENTQQNDLAVTYMLGTALIRDKQVNKGQELVDRILRHGNTAAAHLMLGSAKMAVRDLAGARDEFAKAVQLDPNLPEAHGLYAQALEATGDPDHAMGQFRAELKNNPYDYNSNLQVGVLLTEDHQFDEAMKYFRRALNTRPGDIATRYQIATIHFQQGQTEEAKRELEAIVKEAPDFRSAHVTLATAYYRLKDTADGNRERAIVRRLTAEAQAQQPGVRAAEAAEKRP